MKIILIYVKDHLLNDLIGIFNKKNIFKNLILSTTNMVMKSTPALHFSVSPEMSCYGSKMGRFMEEHGGIENRS